MKPHEHKSPWNRRRFLRTTATAGAAAGLAALPGAGAVVNPIPSAGFARRWLQHDGSARHPDQLPRSPRNSPT